MVSTGFVEKNGLLDVELLHEKAEIDEDTLKKAEEQSLLIFDNGTDEQFGIAIPLIRRIDDLKKEKIQHIGDKEYTEYRGEQMRLLRLENYLPIQRPKETSEQCTVLIPKQAQIPVGIIINRVIDTQNVEIQLAKGTIQCKGILGSTLINSRITLILDLYSILEMGEPNSINIDLGQQKKYQNAQLLLVEDTPFFMKLVSEYLQSVGDRVVTAINGRQALYRLRTQKIDLVLSDIEMPEMDGWELVKQIRANPDLKDIPVLALTSLNDERLMKAGLESGFNEWMVKLDKEQILKRISQYL